MRAHAGTTGLPPALHAHAGRARRWLLDHALPLWHARGIDRARGGFVERLALTGEPDESRRRTRVAARQVYCFALGGRLGWTGPFEEAVRHGVAHLLGPARRSDGLLAHVTALDGRIVEPGPDLYDQAFFLLALACAHPLLPDLRLDREAELAAARLRAGFAHPGGGFEDALPPRLPLRANPHMHLFEAALAWLEAGRSEPWRALAGEIAELMQRRFLDPSSGALNEYFEPGWRPVPPDGQALEPGHHFEWAWLLLRWRDLSGVETKALAAGLFDAAERHGVDRSRGVAIDELGPGFRPRVRTARLWPQTERLKAGLALARAASGEAERARAFAAALEACAALELYLDTPLPGLWRDRMREDGSFVEEPAPASSFYHLVSAVAELAAFAA